MGSTAPITTSVAAVGIAVIVKEKDPFRTAMFAAPLGTYVQTFLPFLLVFVLESACLPSFPLSPLISGSLSQINSVLRCILYRIFAVLTFYVWKFMPMILFRKSNTTVKQTLALAITAGIWVIGISIDTAGA